MLTRRLFTRAVPAIITAGVLMPIKPVFALPSHKIFTIRILYDSEEITWVNSPKPLVEFNSEFVRYVTDNQTIYDNYSNLVNS